MDNLTLLTYTHTKAKDLHEAYFGRIEQFFPGLKHNYVLCNEEVKYATCYVYNDSDKHSRQMIDALDRVDTNYILYSQEDYVLFDYVKVQNLKTYIEVLDRDPEVGFIRLIHSGLGTLIKPYSDTLATIDVNSEYYFSTQATIWRKEVLREMFKLSQIESVFEEPRNSPYLRQLGTTGLFTLYRGDRVGGHYNSYDYPYIATAKVKGRWNTLEYPNELEQLFKEYSIG